jgi:gas vesicle protein
LGAATALVLAPQSGAETREQIREKSLELQTKAGETLADSRAKVEAIAADVRRRAEDFQAKSKAMLADGETYVAQVVAGTKEMADEAAGSAESQVGAAKADA